MDAMKTLAALTIAAATLLIGGAQASAQPREGCEMGDFQGIPLEMCPTLPPDPTNCYTGDYQGIPIEICLPTGEKLPEVEGVEPPAYHVSKDYVPSTATPVETPAAAVATPTATPTTTVVPVAAVALDPLAWLGDLQAALVANGGW